MKKTYLVLAIFLVLAVFLVFAVSMSGFLNDSTDTTEGVVPSGYQETNSVDMGDGVTMTQYLVDADEKSEVTTELKQAAQEEGWEEIGSWESSVSGQEIGVALEKGDEVMLIHTIVQEEGQAVATIYKGPRSELEGIEDSDGDSEPSDDQDEPPTTDVEGEDLEEVPRYPDSVRINYGKMTQNGGEIVYVDYLASDNLDNIQDYYEDALSNQGWSNIQTGSVTQDGETEKWLMGEMGEKSVQIYIHPSEYEDYAEIEIVVEK